MRCIADVVKSGNTGSTKVVIIRHEDVVNKPHEVVAELQRLGLPRNKQEFKPIEDYLAGIQSARRGNRYVCR